MALPLVALLVMTGTWALMIAAIRSPMGTPPGSATLKVFLLSGAVMLTWREASSQVLSGRWSSYAFVLLATFSVLFSPALVWVLGAATTPVLLVILAVAWIAGLVGLARDCRDEPAGQIAAAVAVGAALGLVYFLYVNTKGYGTVFSPEQALLGTQHRDTLFHASIAAMLGRFEIPATGLDGLVRVRYYFVSHALIGVTGRWIGVAPLHAYYLVNQLLNLPLLIFSLTAATFWLWRPAASVRGGLATLLVPLLLLMTFEIWEWGSYLVSESFALSLALLLLSLPLVMELQERPRDTGIGDALARYLALALAGLAIVLTKSSVGAMFAGGVLFVAVRAPFKPLRLIIVGVMMVGVVWLGLRVTSTPAYSTQPLIGPLHFFRTYPTSAYPNMWAILLPLAAGLWVWRSAERRLRVNIELLAVIALAGLGCGLLFQIASGAAYYFMNVGVWMALVVGSGSFILPRLHRVRRQGLVTAGLIGAVALAILAQPDKRHAGANLVTLATVIESQALTQESGVAATPRARPTLLAFLSPGDPIRPHIADVVRRTPGGRMYARLMAGTVPSAVTPADVVYVPPDNTAFWQISKIVCNASPFFVPALAARPMVLGLPPSREACPLPSDTGYGYGDYKETSRSVALSDTELCADVRSRGFQTALVLESPDASRTVSCR